MTFDGQRPTGLGHLLVAAAIAFALFMAASYGSIRAWRWLLAEPPAVGRSIDDRLDAIETDLQRIGEQLNRLDNRIESINRKLDNALDRMPPPLFDDAPDVPAELSPRAL